MMTLPKISRRKAVPYLYVRSTLVHRNIKRQFPVFIAELRSYLKDLNVSSYGPALMRFNKISANGDHDLEFGYITKVPLAGSGPIRSGMLPSGDFATATWTGHFDKLPEIRAMMNGWAERNGVEWARAESGESGTFACKVEFFHSSPENDSDAAHWRTEVAIQIAQQAASNA
jgi:hypothetical protein